ncbi:MAG: phenylalanine--tRNA ligase subunit alpha [Gammaproteobacteria bacterium]|nr:phenylalanine--tRNA ligase subunit alpha [Gammaproteobacteria bacterium]
MNNTNTTLDELTENARSQIESASSLEILQNLRVHYLGKKGELTAQLKAIGGLSHEQKRSFGQQVNQLKTTIGQWIDSRREILEKTELASQLAAEKIDVTQPGRTQDRGRIHPISRTLDKMEAIFSRLGFDIASGPEIEDDYYNFEALNIPADHPARAMHDTFYVDEHTVLRTHTSPVQIRYMHGNPPPIRVIAPGKVYRCDSDVTHTPMFHQLEGLAVDTNITFADLKGILIHFVQEFFEQDLGVRFRPSYFPFTEPSAEVDIACVFCAGEGCRVCKHTGWIEVLGCGMVHPRVLEYGDIDPQDYSGYAFGLGVERLSMLRYGVNDLRLYFDNDLDFLRQF